MVVFFAMSHAFYDRVCLIIRDDYLFYIKKLDGHLAVQEDIRERVMNYGIVHTSG